MRHLAFLLLAVSLAGCAAETNDVASSTAAASADDRIRTSSAYAQASSADRARVDRIAATATSKAKADLAFVLEAGASRLFETDKDGASTLANLDVLYTQDMHAKIAALGERDFNGTKIREAVLHDVAHPGDIHQGRFNTCQITNLQYALAKYYPAEYVRLARGLVGTSGKVKMRKGGELALFTKYLTPKPNDDRSASEALFQTAVMDEITGSYDPQRDQSTLLFFPYPGNSTHMAEATFEQLFGTDYVVEGVSDLAIVLDHHVKMDVDDARREVARLRAGGAPVMVDAVLEGGDISHSLLVTKIEGGRFYLRNPWGPSSLTTHSGRLEDASEAIYSMTFEELARQLQTTISPR